MQSLAPEFPFTAVAGQAPFKLALILAAVNPAIGGVLVSGPRGSAKSTLAKGLAGIMPINDSGAQSFVNLPLGATEEMLIGTLSLQDVLDGKKVQFQPGLLQKADGGVLYVDEVNLLPDNLVDQLLDVAASGVNNVERDGISHQHPARFILLGTMNPDEGELRPQLQDRFGLSVQLSNSYTLDERIEIVRLREQFEKDPVAFCLQYRQQQAELVKTIEHSRLRLRDVACSTALRRLIAQLCAEASVEGLRADIVWYQAAIARAAIEQRKQVNEGDVRAVEELVLNHRRNESTPPQPPRGGRPDKSYTQPSQSAAPRQHDGDWGAMEPVEQSILDVASPFELSGKPKNTASRAVLKQTHTLKQAGQAHGPKACRGLGEKISWPGSIIDSGGRWPIQKLRYRPQKRGGTVLHILLVDTSGSVLSGNGFGLAKGMALQLCAQAYVRREQVVMFGFGNQQTEVLLGRRKAPKSLRNFLDKLPASGGTPLVEALSVVQKFQARENRATPAIQFKTYLITDGRVSHCPLPMQLHGEVVVFDIEQSLVRRGKSRDIARLLGAQYVQLVA